MQIQKSNSELLQRISESEVNEISIKFEQTKWNREKLGLEQQNNWINEELNNKSDQLLQLRKEKVSFVKY
jgi:hypothetical protein